MNNEAENLISEIGRIADEAKGEFGSLSPAQINWKPAADGWSVGQCFEHLIKTNALFFPDLEKIGLGTREHSFLEKYSPLSGFFGNLLVTSLRKDERKFKAPTPAIVPPSEIEPNIVEQFTEHQRAVIDKIKRTENADWQKTVITSPFMKLMTYKLADGFQVVVEHEKRHLRQAKRVIKTDGFPTA